MTAHFDHTATEIEWKEFASSSHTHDAGDINSGTLPIARGGTGTTSATAAANKLCVHTLLSGTQIPANSDLNDYTAVGNYSCPVSTNAATLSNAPTANAFIMKVFYANGGSSYIAQEISDYASGVKYYRMYSKNANTWDEWKHNYTTANKPTLDELGAQAKITGGISNVVSTNFSASKALVSNASGKAASSSVTSTELGYLSGVTSAIQTQLNGKYSSTNKPSFSNITGTLAADTQLSGKVPIANGGTGSSMANLPASAVIRNSSDGTGMWYTATANGAFYATSANGLPKFGTLPVAQGGTGATTFTSGAALIGAGTGAVTTRAITNSTANTTAITASTNLVTMNTLRYALNRTTGVGSNDTNYTTAMMRAIKASTNDLTAGTSSLTSGMIYLVYE